MTGCLPDLLESEKQAIIETVYTRVRTSDAVHYRTEDAIRFRGRIERLVEAFIASTRDQPGEFSRYVRSITEERIREGYHLREIQLVMSVLEAKGWEICAHRVADRAELLKDLAVLTSTVGAAKDELARVYLDLGDRARASAAALERRVQQLMAGTV